MPVGIFLVIHFILVATCQPYDEKGKQKQLSGLIIWKRAKLLQSLPCQTQRGFCVCDGLMFLNVWWAM